ncbi:MAG: menaquinol oxidoreductase, partial [Geobacteraceae bacterium]
TGMGTDSHKAGPPESPTDNTDSDALRLAVQKKIHRLRRTANRGLWAMALFLVVSIAALNNFSFLPPLPEHIREMLGAAPPTIMISGLLILYSFSSLVLILARMIGDSTSHGGFYHVAYLTGFYCFYNLAGSLEDNFWAVFAAGATILSLEGYHLWTWCSRQISTEIEELDKLDEK